MPRVPVGTCGGSSYRRALWLQCNPDGIHTLAAACQTVGRKHGLMPVQLHATLYSLIEEAFL